MTWSLGLLWVQRVAFQGNRHWLGCACQEGQRKGRSFSFANCSPVVLRGNANIFPANRFTPSPPLKQYRFSAPEVRGELPKSGAICLDHPISRGIIFGDNQQATKHDKGEIIAEYVGLLLHNAGRVVTERFGAVASTGTSASASVGGGSSRRPRSRSELNGGVALVGGGGDGSGDIDVGGDSSGTGDALAPSPCPSQRPRRCVLVDNTSRKCEKATETFKRHAAVAGGGLELHAIHYTEAENLVDSPDALRQLRVILARLRARGLIGVDLVAEDILSTR